MNRLLMTVGMISLTTGLAFAQTGNERSSNDGAPVVVEIDGKKITLADFEQRRPTSLFQARNTFYQSERKAIEEFIDQYLLEEQAKKEGLTVEKLLERDVNSTLPADPSDDALRVYYEGVDTNQPYEVVKGQIVESLRQRRLNKAKAAYVQTLRSKSNPVIVLTPPRAPVTLADTPVRGVTTAPVTIVEYADYECPYCQQGQPALDKIEADFKGKLAFAFKDVPLPMHPHAQKAAEAAHCAGVQGKYWEYHDRLFATQQLEVPNLKEHARQLKLEASTFDKCLDSNETADLVKKGLAEGQNLGLQGTPSFLINGRFFSGNLSYDELHAIVEEELKATGSVGTQIGQR